METVESVSNSESELSHQTLKKNSYITAAKDHPLETLKQEGLTDVVLSPEVKRVLSRNKMPEQFQVENESYGFAKDWHKRFPPMIVVSITNVCNQKCVHCFSEKFMESENYQKGFLPYEIWTKICDETGKWPRVIMNFGTDGEPLLHPRFLDMLRYAKEKGVGPINITCNGTRLTKEFNQAIVDEDLVDVMNVSLDAIRPETYMLIRKMELAPIMNRVHDLIERNKQSGKTKLKVQVNIIDQPESHDEVGEFKEYWDQYADQVLIRTYYDATSVTGETGGNVTGRQAEFEKIDRWPCQMFWRRLNIGEDGNIRYCTDDWFNKTKIGDLHHQTIEEVWTGEIYNYYRHLHMQKQFNKNPYCAKCTEWQGMKWDYDYFLAMEKLLNEKFL